MISEGTTPLTLRAKVTTISLVMLSVLAIALGAAWITADGNPSETSSVSRVRIPPAPRQTALHTDELGVDDGTYVAASYVMALNSASLAAFADGIGQATDYVNAVVAEEARQAEAARIAEEQAQAAREAAVRQSPPSAPAPSGQTAPSSQGMSSGGHSDAWWHGVANCEQGGRNDPYYGYFSWMDGSAAGLSWDQQVAKSNALLAQVKSSGGGESPAWAPACVAAGYAASPGG